MNVVSRVVRSVVFADPTLTGAMAAMQTWQDLDQNQTVTILQVTPMRDQIGGVAEVLVLYVE